MGREVELKLMASPEAAGRRFLHHRLITRHARGEGDSLLLSNAYYDTPDFALRGHGMALRVRRAGNRWEQTVKTVGTSLGGLSQRGEWQWALDGPELRPALVPESLWPPGLKERLDRLQPVFHTDFKREIRRIVLPEGLLAPGQAPALIEVAWDVGRITAPGTAAPARDDAIREIELELKQGDPGTLFDFALAAADGLALFPCDISKAERGFRLLGLAGGKNAAEPPGDFLEETAEISFSSCMSAALGSWIREVEAFRFTGGQEHLRATLAAAQDAQWLLRFFKDLLSDEDLGSRQALLSAAAGRIRGRLDAEAGEVAAWSEADGAAMLALVRWVYCRDWRRRWENRHRRAARLSLERFCGDRIDEFKEWRLEASLRWKDT